MNLGFTSAMRHRNEGIGDEIDVFLLPKPLENHESLQFSLGNFDGESKGDKFFSSFSNGGRLEEEREYNL